MPVYASTAPPAASLSPAFGTRAAGTRSPPRTKRLFAGGSRRAGAVVQRGRVGPVYGRVAVTVRVRSVGPGSAGSPYGPLKPYVYRGTKRLQDDPLRLCPRKAKVCPECHQHLSTKSPRRECVR